MTKESLKSFEDLECWKACIDNEGKVICYSLIIGRLFVGYPLLGEMGEEKKKSFKSFEDLECLKACTEVRRFISELVKKYPKDERFAIVDDMKRAAWPTNNR